MTIHGSFRVSHAWSAEQRSIVTRIFDAREVTTVFTDPRAGLEECGKMSRLRPKSQLHPSVCEKLCRAPLIGSATFACIFIPREFWECGVESMRSAFPEAQGITSDATVGPKKLE